MRMTEFDWAVHIDRATPALADHELSLTEEQLGLPLPGELRVLYGAVGTGVFKRQNVFAADDFEYNLFALLNARPSIDGPSELVDHYRSLVLEKRLVKDNHVPFAVGAGGDVFTVSRADGSVWFWPMDGEPSPRQVARSVRLLLESLLLAELGPG